MTKRIWTNIFIMTLMVSLIAASTTKAEEPVKLEWKLKAGDVLTYKAEMDTTTKVAVMSIEMKSEMLITSIVTGVDEDGVMTGGDIVVFKLLQALANGKDMTSEVAKQPGLPQNSLRTWKMHPNGHKTSVSELAEWFQFGGALETTVESFPEKPVKVGDSWRREWTEEISIPLLTEVTASFTSTSTLLGFEKIKEYNCAKVKTIRKVTMKGENYTSFVSSECMTFFAFNKGFPVKMESTMESTTNIVMKQPFEMKIKTEMQTEMQMELSKRKKLKGDELKQVREELVLIRAAQELVEKKKPDEAKAEFEKFLANHPQSKWRKGVEGLISQIDMMKEMEDTMEDVKKQMEEVKPSNEEAQKLNEEVQKLEKELKANPDDLSIRTKLLDYYSSERFRSAPARKARQQHILWIIQNHPDAKIAGSPEAGLIPILDDNETYDKAKQLWLEQVKKHKKNTAVLGNAAHFFLLFDRDISEELLKKAQALEPNNPEWPNRLGHLYMMLVIIGTESPDARKEIAKKALEQFEKSANLTVGEEERFYMLSGLAKAAFEADDMKKAERYANKLLDTAPQYKGNWNYGNAIHHGNIILGRIALKSGKIEKAKSLLLKAGATPGSPHLDSSGPNMTLAKELLEKGERQAVIEYFQLCAKFWETGKKRLENWTSVVKEGKIPDFGANLGY